MSSLPAPVLSEDFRFDLRQGFLDGEVTRRFELDQRVGVEFIALAQHTPVELVARLDPLDNGVYVWASLEGRTDGECVRCLRPISGDLRVTISQLYADEAHGYLEKDEDSDVGLIRNDLIDLGQPVIDAVGLALPISPTCETIEGHPCPEGDTPAPDGISGEVAADAIDPRWAALKEKYGSEN